MRRRGVTAGLMGILAIACVALPAPAGGAPVYRDPPGYKGIKKPPKTKPQPLPPAVELSANGTNPDVLVDEAGTAHITWNDERGSDSDAAMYCRLERGATACDATAMLTWEKTYGVGDGPQFNNDYLGPRIVRVGDQLLILSKRYPTVADKPDGASSSTMIAWSSNDGGASWSSAAIVGKWNLGQVVQIGPGDDPSLVNLAHDPFCGMCVSELKSGVYSTGEGVLNTDPNSNYNGTIVPDGASLVAGFNDLAPRTWLRRWNGQQPITNPANWSTSPPIPGDEPELASGPAGVFLMNRPGYFGPYQVRALSTQPDNTVTAGPETTISSDAGAQFGRLIEDASGRLTAAWQQDGSGVLMRRSTSGAAGFGAQQRLADGDSNGQIELDATADGGGFAVLNHTGFVNSPGQLLAVGFGKQNPTGLPGIGGLAGGGASNVSCQQIGFGKFAVEAAEGCFVNGTGASKGLVVTRGEVTLNGLRIVPDPGSRLVFDPKALTIDTIGKASVIASNGSTELVLFHGGIHRNLSGVGPGTPLFEFPLSEFKANILGFDVAADLPVILTEGGVRIPIDVELPPQFGGFTGHAELIVDRARGLVLDSLNISIGPVPLGVLIVEEVAIDWRQGEFWRGSGKLRFPATGTLDAFVEFQGGDFAGAGFNYPLNPPAAIGPFVYLLSIGGQFFIDPVKIIAEAAFGAGAAFAGEAPVKVDGAMTMEFPKGAPAKFLVTGAVQLFMIHVAEGFLKFETDGYAQFGGNAQLDIGPVEGGMEVNGFVDATAGEFGADLNGNAKACLEFPNPFGDPVGVCGGVGADAAVSNVGFAACASIDPPDFIPGGPITGGLAVKWDEINPAVLYSPILLTAELVEAITIPCDTGEYRIPPPRPRPRGLQKGVGGQAFAIEAGLPSATVLVKGTGGVPQVTVTGPSGETVSGTNPSAAGYVVQVAGADAAWVVLNKPAGGTWTVSSATGSPAIGEVLVSNGLPAAKVSGNVKRGRISYRIKNLGEGRTVSFRESGRFGTHLLGSVDKKRGTLRFKPAGGAGGKRKVIAQVERDGLITDQFPIGTYRAPNPPKPGPVDRVRAKRGKRTLAVSFRPANGSARTQVTIKGSGGERLAAFATGRQKRVRFDGLKWAKRRGREGPRGIGGWPEGSGQPPAGALSSAAEAKRLRAVGSAQLHRPVGLEGGRRRLAHLRVEAPPAACLELVAALRPVPVDHAVGSLALLDERDLPRARADLRRLGAVAGEILARLLLHAHAHLDEVLLAVELELQLADDQRTARLVLAERAGAGVLGVAEAVGVDVRGAVPALVPRDREVVVELLQIDEPGDDRAAVRGRRELGAVRGVGPEEVRPGAPLVAEAGVGRAVGEVASEEEVVGPASDQAAAIGQQRKRGGVGADPGGRPRGRLARGAEARVELASRVEASEGELHVAAVAAAVVARGAGDHHLAVGLHRDAGRRIARPEVNVLHAVAREGRIGHAGRVEAGDGEVGASRAGDEDRPVGADRDVRGLVLEAELDRHEAVPAERGVRLARRREARDLRGVTEVADDDDPPVVRQSEARPGSEVRSSGPFQRDRGAAARAEGGVERAVGGEAGDDERGGPAGEVLKAGHEDLAVGLQREVRAAGGAGVAGGEEVLALPVVLAVAERLVRGPVRPQARDRGVVEQHDFPVGLDRDRLGEGAARELALAGEARIEVAGTRRHRRRKAKRRRRDHRKRPTPTKCQSPRSHLRP